MNPQQEFSRAWVPARTAPPASVTRPPYLCSTAPPERDFCTTPMQISVYQSLESLHGISLKWDQLLAKCPGATTFSTWEWLGSWWRAFGTGKLFVLGFYSASELVGLAPLCITEREIGFGFRINVVRFMGDGSGDSDNLDIIAKPGWEERVSASLLDCLDEARGNWSLVELNTMPSESRVGRSLTGDLACRGWRIEVRKRPASAINLPDNWSAYLQGLTSEDRNNLIRYRKRLEKHHNVRFRKVMVESEIQPCLDAMYQLHQQRWQLRGETGSFAVQERRSFYAEISRLFLARGWLELWALDVDSRTVATQFAFRFRNRVFQLQEGFDPKCSSDRVGMVLRSHVIMQLITEGVKCYDFLSGRLGYKARWGATRTQYLSLRFARRRTLGSTYLAIMKNAVIGKEYLRNNLPTFAWTFLHKLKLRGSSIFHSSPLDRRGTPQPPQSSMRL